MGIFIGKFLLYIVCGGIFFVYMLLVMFDVGINNEKLLNDFMYMGVCYLCISQEEYDEFFDMFMCVVSKCWLEVMIQFEDFVQFNVMLFLKCYCDCVCCFNDDIQGIVVVMLGIILVVCRMCKVKLFVMNIVFVGVGFVGCGIVEMLIQ